MTFYDSKGRAVAYTEDGENIYLFTGEPVAYFYGDLIYSFSGKHLGRFAKGWVRDLNGRCVFFTENAIGGPFKPFKQFKPLKHIKHIKPIKGIRSIPFLKPLDKMGWSEFSGERFFFIG